MARRRIGAADSRRCSSRSACGREPPASTAAAIVRADLLTVAGGDPRRARPEIHRAAVSHARGAGHRAADAMVAAAFAWSIVLLNGSGVLLLQLLGVPTHGPSSRALPGGDRAPDRREPRRRSARAAGAGAAPSRAAARTAHRPSVDGAARAARGHRRSRRPCPTCCASSPRAHTAGCPSTAARWTTSSASCTPKTSVTALHRSTAARRSLARCCARFVRVPDSMPGRPPARLPARAAEPSGARGRSDGSVAGLITLEDVVGSCSAACRTSSSRPSYGAAASGRPRRGCPGAMRLDQAGPAVAAPGGGGNDTVGASIVFTRSGGCRNRASA